MVIYDDITEKEATEETTPVRDEAEAPVPPVETPNTSVSESTAEPPTQKDAPSSDKKEEPADPAAETTEAPLPSEESRSVGRLVSPGNGKHAYRTGTKIAAFVFFLITAAIFTLYEYFAFTFLYLPLMESIDNLGEAIAAIFGYIFGLIYTIIFAIAQLPANIISIILFKRLRGKSDKKWENVLFTVFFALSIVTLLVTVISTLLFFGMSALGG